MDEAAKEEVVVVQEGLPFEEVFAVAVEAEASHLLEVVFKREDVLTTHTAGLVLIVIFFNCLEAYYMHT